LQYNCDEEEQNMGAPRSTKKARSTKNASPLMVRLDEESKRCLAEAADLRQISVSDYVRTVTVPQARRELSAARDQVIALTREEQRAFWSALNEVPVLTLAQRQLAAQMRGER
jgi:uncharacterized protein (DUF1778 family)